MMMDHDSRPTTGYGMAVLLLCCYCIIIVSYHLYVMYHGDTGLYQYHDREMDCIVLTPSSQLEVLHSNPSAVKTQYYHNFSHRSDCQSAPRLVKLCNYNKVPVRRTLTRFPSTATLTDVHGPATGLT
jgi:hypothetical protein